MFKTTVSEVRCPEDKKKISMVKNITLIQWKAVSKAINKKINYTRPRLSKLDRRLSLYSAANCGDCFHALQ